MPDFLEPANGEIQLETTRFSDLTLDVNASVGATRLLIDGESVGTLTSSSRVGVLADGQLQLFVRGAMVSGVHTLQLRTPDEVETEESEPVSVLVDPAAAPTLRWEAGESLALGESLVPGATPQGAALGLLIESDGTSSLRVWQARAHGWDTTRSRTVALPGYVRSGVDAAVAIAGRLDGDLASLRVAWRVGDPGTAIATVEVDWMTDDQATEVVGFAPDPAWLGAREWTAIGRPLLAGDLVLAEVTALTDSEHPHPGDQTLAATRWSSVELSTPQIVAVGAVDLLGAQLALDSLPGTSTSIGLRLGRVQPAVLEVDGNSSALGLRPTHAIVDDPRWGEVDGPLLTALGAFGSRIVAGLHRDRNAVLLAWIDDSGANEATVRRVALPDDALAAGSMAVALVSGAVVLLVPRGNADMVAITTTSDAPDTQTLVGLACDAVAAARTAPGNEAASVAVACLHARSLDTVSLGVE